ncbi:response regulator [Oligoflexus tunisiensis]|uniref:response regulator n=1 Tax=Oligoflexus tunisiensis TaxID=708132 RepID=UPI00114CBC07|nr:response regulator [Oligoflexus tunisiensis]
MIVDKASEELLVAAVMDTRPCMIPQDTKVADALTQLTEKRIESCVVVEKNGSVRGSLDFRDLALAQMNGKKSRTLADLCSQTPLLVDARAQLLPVLEDMKKRGLRLAAVVDGNKAIGVLHVNTIGMRLPEILGQKQREIQELRADRDAKDEYLGLVSHDMRAPLSVISLSTDYLLTAESGKALSPDQKSFIERIKRNGEQAASMIHDILDVVRLEHGFSLDYRMTRFADLVQDSIQNLQVVAAKKNITFQVSFDHDIQVNLDPQRMRQVIENVLINAIKFSPPGGQVFVKSWLTQKAGSDHLAFQVRDQGQGIRKEDEAKVFEAFVQTGRSIYGKDGVGLGLAIVRKFVEFHQGSIELDGGWQKGASLTIFMPNASLVTTPASQATPQGPVVLLVEDDESIREFYKQSLEEYKFHVIQACDGVEAFALFQQHAVDLVLSDIRMPNVDGLELLARIRTSGSQVPVILCSGYYIGLENDLTRSDHKPNRIIDKPFKVKDMVEAIEDQLRRYKQAS